MTRRLLLLVLLVAPLYTWRLNQPGFSDTEGMYAEPAREMVVSGDWVTPRMNGEPFLTKPPLMYWLPATVFALTGPTEYARVWSMLAALATVAATGALGCELFGDEAGVAAATVLATAAGFFVEARMLRTDMVLMLVMTLMLYWYVRLRRGAGVGTAVAFWVTLGVGILDKGFVPLVLVGVTIAIVEIIAGELRPATLIARLRALHAPWGVLLMVAIVLPWHLLAGVQNPGFLWDYVVNQHLLFFFDKKLPRDSIPDPLGLFWAAFFARGLPWSLLLPAAVIHAWRTAGIDRARGTALRLPAMWLAIVLGFFSLAVSRLEHYSLPAQPAAALLVGSLLADVTEGRGRVGRGWLVGLPVVVALLAFAVTLSDPSMLIVAIDPTLAGHSLETLVRPAMLTLGVGLLGFALLLARQCNKIALWGGAATAVALLPFVQIAHERVEPLFSWRPFARLIRETAPEGSRVFFHAEDEYQLCGGLDYYLGQYVDLLAPPGWTAPTFLAGRTDHLFTPYAEFAHDWRTGTAVFVSDDVHGPDDEAQRVPGGYVVLARAGERVLLWPAAPKGEQACENIRASVTTEEQTKSKNVLRESTIKAPQQRRQEDLGND
jgi:4-amino-4-deoxy-L-arabinose transferase-like glycosyltransferase